MCKGSWLAAGETEGLYGTKGFSIGVIDKLKQDEEFITPRPNCVRRIPYFKSRDSSSLRDASISFMALLTTAGSVRSTPATFNSSRG